MDILFKGPFRKVREINARYKHPRIHQSLGVRAALLILRIYLLLSVALLVYTFARTMRGG